MSIIPSNIQLLIVNIYFVYKIFSLDWNQNSIKNDNIADCLKKIWKLVKQNKLSVDIWWETVRELIDRLERLGCYQFSYHPHQPWR